MALNRKIMSPLMCYMYMFRNQLCTLLRRMVVGRREGRGGRREREGRGGEDEWKGGRRRKGIMADL